MAVKHETSGGRTVAATAIDGDGDSICAEAMDSEVWMTISDRDGDFHQVRLERTDVQQFAVRLAEIAA